MYKSCELPWYFGHSKWHHPTTASSLHDLHHPFLQVCATLAAGHASIHSVGRTQGFFASAQISKNLEGLGIWWFPYMGLFHGKTPQKTSLITVLLGTPILENLRINSRALKNAPKPKSNDSQGRWIGEIHAFHPEIGTKMDQILRSSWIGPRRTYPGDMFRLGKAFHVKWGNPATGAVVSFCCWPYGCGQWMSVVYGLFVLQFENEVKWWYQMHSNLFM